MTNSVSIAQQLISYIGNSPTPFHATQNALNMLLKHGFERLSETDSWDCQANKAYVVTRNDSSIIAFRTGRDLQQGIRMVGAHTDSPCLKIKPNAQMHNHGYLQLGVEVYGGALLHTWMDRDLSIAGRVSGIDKNGQLFNQLIDCKKAIAVIPSLAIHLNREANSNSSINAQTDLPLIIAQSDKPQDFKQFLLSFCDSNASEILDFELSCYDTQAPAIVGLNDEFICSARLDNLLSTFIGLRALIDTPSDCSTLFIASDHEEVGSASACGAQGPFLQSILERLSASREELSQLISRSEFLSCDNAHGIHPNYADKHDQNHGPLLNQGPVIKHNSNQRYATNSVSSAHFQKLCAQKNIPVQHFVVRSDMGCGSTIGPITASQLGINTLDIGVPQWAMHSIRETAGSRDCEYLHHAIVQFLSNS